MLSIRKQFFTIFLTMGFTMLIITSLIINSIITKNFKDYVSKNIEQIGSSYVNLIQNAIDNEILNEKTFKNTFVENPMGNFAFSLLDADKNYQWGMDKQSFFKKLENDMEVGNPIYSSQYHEIDKAYYNKEGELAGYVRIGYYPGHILSKNDKRFQTNVQLSLIWCASIILIWFVFAGLYLSRLFTYHIYGISKTSIALADGKLSARYLFKSKTKEIETLRHSMNYLGEKLERQDAIRKKLISDVSHEIRTPLQVLQSNLEAMIDGIYPIDEEQMQMLYKEVVRFGKLLNNLDLLKNVEESETAMNYREVILNKELYEVFDAFKIVAKEKKIDYYIKIAETEQVVLWADKDALKQLWMNIISNAFKFTGEKGQIKIETKLNQKECLITIEDSGIGIAEEDLPYVFERMYRGDKSREQYEGSGIGLTIVKNVVEKHGGRIKIESQEGVYTRVSVTLPVYSLMPSSSSHVGSKVKAYMKLKK